ncbi:MAG TPA: hypothetical protein VMX17_16490 [Candidatus Glassbacteria bacterium]|nr:hypothetical protein [Candidatus Glassbacteria bacterium]
MTLCPNCKSIQKAGKPCTICKQPIPLNPGDPIPEPLQERRTDDKRTYERRINGKDFLDKE